MHTINVSAVVPGYDRTCNRKAPATASTAPGCGRTDKEFDMAKPTRVVKVPHGRPGQDLECCHPKCSASPQTRYEFPIPLCSEHIIKVLTVAGEIVRDARRDHVVLNQNSLPVPMRGNSPYGHAPVVYYMRFGDRVKIGTTTNMRNRASQ